MYFYVCMHLISLKHFAEVAGRHIRTIYSKTSNGKTFMVFMIFHEPFSQIYLKPIYNLYPCRSEIHMSLQAYYCECLSANNYFPLLLQNFSHLKVSLCTVAKHILLQYIHTQYCTCILQALARHLCVNLLH